VRVFAAASLADVMEDLALEWMAQGHPGPVVNLAGSSTLARQIENGAEADVVLSADEQWMDYLAERSLVDASTRAALLGNSLVLIAPANSTLDVSLSPGTDLAAKLAGGKLALADPDGVPAGRYAREALVNLGMWDGVEPLVVRAGDVRAALRFVTSGEAEAGIVYATDARAAGDAVRILGAFPEESHAPVVYPVALTAAGAQSIEGRTFRAFLGGPEARAIFTARGFTALPAGGEPAGN